MKKLFVLIAVLMMVAGTAGFAISQATTVSGTITDVKGDVVTVEIDKGKGAAVKVGDSVDMTIKGQKKAPKSGADMLQGC